MPNDNTLKIGLIGAGRIGTVHAKNLTYHIPQAKLVAVSDPSFAAARKCAADFNIPAAYQSHHAILDERDIDAVLICSSTDSHAELIAEAAAAKKHIFCEKPIALSLNEIDRALAAVARHGVKLQIGFMRRFDPNFKKIKQAVATGKIGVPHLIRISSRDPSPPPIDYIKVSGGIFMDMTIHDFDMARYVVESQITEVYAIGSVLVDSAIGQAGDIDTAVITLRYANGCIATIDNSRQAVYGYDQRMEIFGSEGMVQAENNRPHNAIYSNKTGLYAAPPLYFVLERYTAAYIAELKAFVACIIKNTPPPVTGLDGRVSAMMGLAAWKSYREKRPVKLHEIK